MRGRMAEVPGAAPVGGTAAAATASQPVPGGTTGQPVDGQPAGYTGTPAYRPTFGQRVRAFFSGGRQPSGY
jgi:hypothetical protein